MNGPCRASDAATETELSRAAWNGHGTPGRQTAGMPIDKLCASYILRLTQRLSRLTFELREVRSGRTHRFDSTGELSRFLEAAVVDRPPESRLQDDVGDPAWNAAGTSGRHPEGQGECK